MHSCFKCTNESYLKIINYTVHVHKLNYYTGKHTGSLSQHYPESVATGAWINLLTVSNIH